MESMETKNSTFQLILIGALIGLARATDGNVNRPTLSTHKAMLSGMRIALHKTEASKEIDECIQSLHCEKEKLVARCSKCKHPCGRNDDYDISDISKSNPELSTIKHKLMSKLLSLEPLIMTVISANDESSHDNELQVGIHTRCSGVITDTFVNDKVMDLIYKGFFNIGRDCDIEMISSLIFELDEIRSELIGITSGNDMV